MSMTTDEPTLQELVSRLAELEQAHTRLQEKLTSVRATRANAEEQAPAQPSSRSRRSSRRKVLAKGLGVAVATVGAGAMLELSAGTALADKAKPGVFASSVSGTPAVSATGSNGADGVDASSDSGTGLVATSSSGLAGHFVGNVGMDNDLNVAGALSSSSGTFTSTGTAGHFAGNVNMDNNLNVAGALSTGTLSSGPGTLNSNLTNTPSVRALGTSGAAGVDASSDSGTAVFGFSNSGTAVSGNSTHGLAGFFEGNVNVVNGTLSTSALRSGAANFASNTLDIPAVRAFGSNGTVGVSASSDSGSGVFGFSSSGVGIFGSSGTNGLAGVFEGNVSVNGNLSVTGTKNFVQAHPTDPSREIAYVALEGGEAGTYVRGTGTLVNGKAVIALPEHFGLVTENQGLTINLTPRGEWLQLYMVELDTAQLVVREAQGKSGAFDYLIHGVRRGYEHYQVIRTKR